GLARSEGDGRVVVHPNAIREPVCRARIPHIVATAAPDEISAGDRRHWRREHVLTNEETRMWRLVIPPVFPSDGTAILRVVHQRIEAIRGKNCRGVDAEIEIVRSAPNDLLAPIAEKIGAQTWRGFCAVVGRKSAGREQGTA